MFTSYSVLSHSFSPVKTSSFLQGSSHILSVACIIFQLLPLKMLVISFETPQQHPVLCLWHLAHPARCDVIWITVAELHSRWLVGSGTMHTKAYSNFTCWRRNKYLCDRLYVARTAATITLAPSALLRCNIGNSHPLQSGQKLWWFGQKNRTEGQGAPGSFHFLPVRMFAF